MAGLTETYLSAKTEIYFLYSTLETLLATRNALAVQADEIVGSVLICLVALLVALIGAIHFTQLRIGVGLSPTYIQTRGSWVVAPFSVHWLFI
jgi:hypothetical protein